MIKGSRVYVKVHAGGGNQLFMYAAGRSLADKLNCDLVLDTSSFVPKTTQNEVLIPPCHPREYILHHFQVRFAEMVNLSTNDHGIIDKNDSWFRHKIQKIFGYPKHVHAERKAPFYDASFESLGAGTYLAGYYQCDRYFRDNERIRDDMRFVTPLAGENALFSSQILETPNSVSVHVRRGDYLRPNVRRRMVNCDMEYYRRATGYIAERASGPITCFVFSNDPEFVHRNFKLDHKVVIVDVNDEKNGHFDMRLQSLCAHNVIANSTFSWWAAWLNANPNKIVCAPNKWYVSPRRGHCADIYPDGWVRI